jgi:hypothetical protein
MTYNDPNRPRRVNNGGVGTGTIALIALVTMLVIGGIVYAMSNRGTTSASNTGTSTPTTTGAAVGTTRTDGNASSGTFQTPTPAPGATGAGNTSPASKKP